MKIVGLTGGIGSGKSTVLNLFKELGAATYIADVEAKKLMNNDPELIKQIKKLFGKEAYINNELNKSYIAEIVFSNKEKLTALNKLVHPKVYEHFKVFIKKLSAKIVIYESAILFESSSHTMCDIIITITAKFEDKIDRIIKRDGITQQQILDRMKHQVGDDFKIENSNFVIENKTLIQTKLQVSAIYKSILEDCVN
jgi:dephospho-CoA kinase